MKTFTATPADIERTWWLVDAEGQTLGRLATQIAVLLRGKNKPQFTPNIDTGDYVVIINAEKIQFTGKKATQKKYYRHSGHWGSLKVTALKDVMANTPERVLEAAIRGMLPHTRLGRAQYTKLHVYKGPNHPHAAQKPQVYTVSPQSAAQ